MSSAIRGFTFDLLRRNASARHSLRSATNINKEISKGIQKDARTRAGISLVIGCSLPSNILKGINCLKKELDAKLEKETGIKDLITWRKSPASFHLSVYGILNPAEYSQNASPWDFAMKIAMEIQRLPNAPFDVCFSGIGLRGAGITIGVSDSKELTKLREEISKMGGVSPIKMGAEFNKVIIGRITKPLSEQALPAIRRVFKQFENYDGLIIGKVRVKSLRIVHYRNEHLDNNIGFVDLHLQRHASDPKKEMKSIYLQIINAGKIEGHDHDRTVSGIFRKLESFAHTYGEEAIPLLGDILKKGHKGGGSTTMPFDDFGDKAVELLGDIGSKKALPVLINILKKVIETADLAWNDELFVTPAKLYPGLAIKILAAFRKINDDSVLPVLSLLWEGRNNFGAPLIGSPLEINIINTISRVCKNKDPEGIELLKEIIRDSNDHEIKALAKLALDKLSA